MDKRIICILLLIIIICSMILIYKINQNQAYDKDLYAQVYEEYESIKVSTTNNAITDSAINSASSINPTKEIIHIYKNSSGDSYRTIGIIDIPKINISYPIINDYSEKNLNIAPTKFIGPKINEVGNLVIAGHNNWNREFFSNLNKLEKGDIVNLTDHNKNTLSYKVYDIYETKQNDFSCLNQETNGKIELTLITCIKYQKSKRLIVKCIAN